MNDIDRLSKLKVASPCSARWAAMQGDDRVRFCASCQKNVYNFTGLNPANANAIIREKEGRLCGRFYQRSDGTLLAGDCPVGAMQFWRRVQRLAVAAAAMFFFSTIFVLSTRATGSSAARSRHRLSVAWDDAKWTVKGWLGIKRPIIMGDVCVPAPPAGTTTNFVSRAQ